MNCAAEEVAVVANGLNHHQAAGFAVFLLFSHDGETIEESGCACSRRSGNRALQRGTLVCDLPRLNAGVIPNKNGPPIMRLLISPAPGANNDRDMRVVS